MNVKDFGPFHRNMYAVYGSVSEGFQEGFYHRRNPLHSVIVFWPKHLKHVLRAPIVDKLADLHWRQGICSTDEKLWKGIKYHLLARQSSFDMMCKRNGNSIKNALYEYMNFEQQKYHYIMHVWTIHYHSFLTNRRRPLAVSKCQSVYSARKGLHCYKTWTNQK